jgi:hypothetical protein
MQCQNLCHDTPGVLLRQGIITRGQTAFIQSGSQRGNPGGVEVMENTGVNARPVMHGHGQVSKEREKYRTPDMGRLSPMFFRISVFRPFRKR